MSKKVVVGMSGGVDSSVAALVLRDQGYEVIGMSMRLFSCNRVSENSCCTAKDRRDASAVCRVLGIPHCTVDMSKKFRENVILPFVESYLKGETPSPCILCNEHLKFGAFIEEASRYGTELVATGHYARILQNASGKKVLARGVDVSKDQSYFLFPALRGALEKLLFPIGHLTKQEVRRIAEETKLPVYDKDESQEVCFVPNNDYVAFVEEIKPGEISGPGNFVDTRGRVIGRHRGIHAYTIGQRRGLGIGFGKRKYVLKIDVSKNEVILGEDADLVENKMTVGNVVWATNVNIGDKLDVQIRSTQRGQSATIEKMDHKKVGVVFDKPQRAIAPGQAAVFYRDDKVIGGGWILGN